MPTSWWARKRAVVTGGAGFLGAYLVERLREKECAEVFVPRSSQYDLTQESSVRRLYADMKPDLVIHLAARVGGIGANKAQPASFFYDNLIMSVQLLDQAYRSGVEKFIGIGTVCAYPKFAPIPFSEDDLWNGYPEETNAPYGLAKKMLLVQSQAYRQQYGYNSIFVLPANLYGPRDNCSADASHVIPALIRKCVEARERREGTVTVWGDGSPTRDFLYVEDAAEGILLATEHYNRSEPVNLGSGSEISIKDLVEKIVKLTRFDGQVIWDTSQPNGQARRRLDTSRAEKEFGFRARTSFDDGLARTIAWYEAQRVRELVGVHE